MPPWLRSVLQATYIVIGGLLAGAATVVVPLAPGCNTPPPQPPPPPPPPTPPGNPVDPVGATMRFSMGGVGCTCTLLHERPAPGKYWILCAAHCVRGGPGTGQARLSDGRVLTWRLLRADARSDVALMIADGPDGLPTAKIATAEPSVGTVVWHKGYGVNNPGNVETGTVSGGPDSNGQLAMRLNVSSGDSGSGIFRKDTGEVISVVCCYGGNTTYGGGVASIRRIISAGVEAANEPFEWRPHPIPERGKDGKHGKD